MLCIHNLPSSINPISTIRLYNTLIIPVCFEMSTRLHLENRMLEKLLKYMKLNIKQFKQTIISRVKVSIIFMTIAKIG